MSTLIELLGISAASHNHICPRQVLGVRMGVYAGELLRLSLPQRDKRLVTFVETDGCFLDGVTAVTGCTLGHRTLRLVDFGKVAATFADSHTEAACRIAPRRDIRQRAYQYQPNARSRWHAQLGAYQIMPLAELFDVQWVRLTLSLNQLVSRPGIRTNCEICGEEIINEREIIHEGLTMCLGCAGQSYYAHVKGVVMN